MTRGGEAQLTRKVAAQPAAWDSRPGTTPANWAASPSSMAGTQWRLMQLGDGSFLPCKVPNFQGPSPQVHVGRGAVLLREAQRTGKAKRFAADTARGMADERASGTQPSRPLPDAGGEGRGSATTPNAWWHLPRGDHERPSTRPRYP
eukprot:7104433-Prymnesium_polylepis.1